MHATVSPVRRTPGQIQRRRNIAEAAAGWSLHQRRGGGRSTTRPGRQIPTPRGTPSPRLLARADDGYARFLDGLAEGYTDLGPAFEGAERARQHPDPAQPSTEAR
ncbi:hypothetical protein ACFXPI_04515 [Streptomyces sp. NPDC059104]|uniref:hypothetical protein n=1 Tax=Streptomyces sp. NPDC059104 TaxID=3346729 RepID=UPI0036BE47AC